MPITEGTPIEVVDALGRTFRKRAVSAAEGADGFQAVWACSEQEWAEAEQQGREPTLDPFPWPSSSLRVLAST